VPNSAITHEYFSVHTPPTVAKPASHIENIKQKMHKIVKVFHITKKYSPIVTPL
jgi:hypothetical protein